MFKYLFKIINEIIIFRYFFNKMNDDYAKEKLDFVSNLNGTSLTYLVSLVILFPMINLFSVLLKILLLFCVATNDVQRNFFYFW